MKDGQKRCPFCGSRFTFEQFELVDSMPADQPCEGCIQTFTILALSAERLAKSARLRLERETVLREREQADLSPAANLRRLVDSRQRQSARDQFDPKMAATGERE
jgi:hypothetical protein